MKKPVYKFLDSYSREDRDIFFGRDREVDELFNRVFQSHILLVYGMSGTGKSSLVQCGLASRFDGSDWMSVIIRRGSDINRSISDAIAREAVTPLGADSSLEQAIQSVYLDHFKPVFLIFDQFEELFIFGSHSERLALIGKFQSIMKSGLPYRIILIMREEYMARLGEFEKEIPHILDNRYRVEKVSRQQAIEIIEGPCNKGGIKMEEGFAEAVIDKLTASSERIELTYLQLYLDKLLDHKGDMMRLDKAMLEASGEIGDLLGEFVESQLNQLPDPATGAALLNAFVSAEGTRKQNTYLEAQEAMTGSGIRMDAGNVGDLLRQFVRLRILRDADNHGRYELIHDALASRIFRNLSLSEKGLIEAREMLQSASRLFRRHGTLLSPGNLEYLAPYRERVIGNPEYRLLINASEASHRKARLRRIRLRYVISIAVFAILSGIALWFMRHETESRERLLASQAQRLTLQASELEAIDPTTALRLLEHAWSLNHDPTVWNKLQVVYGQNEFYTYIGAHDGPITCIDVSPDGSRIVTGSRDRTARIWDRDGKLLHTLGGHFQVFAVKFSGDGKYIATGSSDRTIRLWSSDGELIQVLPRQENSVRCIDFSPEDNTMVTIDLSGNASLWSIPDARLLASWHCDLKKPMTVSFSLAGNLIALAGRDDRIMLYTPDGKEYRTLFCSAPDISALAFIPPGDRLLSVTYNEEVTLWDLNDLTSTLIQDAGVGAIIACPGPGKSVFVGYIDGRIDLVSYSGLKMHSFVGHNDPISGLCFSTVNGKLYSISENGVRGFEWIGPQKYVEGPIVSIHHAKYIHTHNQSIIYVLKSPGGLEIVGDDQTTHLAAGKAESNIIDIAFGNSEIATIDDGNKLIICDFSGIIKESIALEAFPLELVSAGNSFFIGCDGGILYRYNSQSGIESLDRQHEKRIELLCASPACDYILSASSGRLILWDAEGHLVTKYIQPRGYLTALEFSPDAKTFAAGFDDGRIRLYELDGTPVFEIQPHHKRIVSIRFLEDQNAILSADLTGLIHVTHMDGKPGLAYRASGNLRDFVVGKSNMELVCLLKDGNIQVIALKPSVDEFLASRDAALLTPAISRLYGIPFRETELKAIDYLELSQTPDSKGILPGPVEKAELLGKAFRMEKTAIYLEQYSDALLEPMLPAGEPTKDWEKLREAFDIIRSSTDPMEVYYGADYYMKRLPLGLDSTADHEFYLNSKALLEQVLRMTAGDSLYQFLVTEQAYWTAWHFLEIGMPSYALEFNALALEVDEKSDKAIALRPLCLLMSGRWEEAENAYRKTMHIQTGRDGATMAEMMLSDIKWFENLDITHPDFEKAKALLNQEE